jgi:hypothetical protein
MIPPSNIPANWAIILKFQKMFTSILISITLITPFVAAFSMPSGKIVTKPEILLQDECEIVLEPLIEGDLSFERLINPILTSQTEINEKVDLYYKMFECLDEETDPLIEERNTIQRLLEYFLIFAGGRQTPPDETTLNLVSMPASTDPAIVKIRDEAGIEAPGGYIFVRFYSTREAMPDLVRQAFESPDVAGVTILSRYIAVLDERKDTWPQRALQLQTLPETISHELIHAYVNSVLGPLLFDLPTWYSEGIAIYFSGSGENHTIVTPNFSISNTSPEDYQQYDLNFKFLEEKLGRDGLIERINRSIETGDPSILYQDLDISDEQQLASRASAWAQQRNYLSRSGLIVVSLAAILLLWRLAPDYRCENCEHGGKKKDLIDGMYCPNCKRPYDRAVPW